jgi:hypothetical protein
VWGRSGLGIGARRSEGEVVGGGDAGVPFYRVGGGVGRLGDGGERVVAVVCHDGGGGGRFGKGSTGVVVGSDEGGGARRHVSAHMRWRWPFDPGRKMTRRGPRAGERGRGGLAGPTKGQGLVARGGVGPMGGKRRVGQPGWKDSRAAAGTNPEPGQNSKRNSFQILIDFRIWQNFGKLYQEI